jgi:hypothetical protein
MFLFKCERPSLTPIQNNRQNYSGVVVSNSHSFLVGVRLRVSALEVAGCSGRAVYVVGLPSLAHQICGFESHRGHGYLLWVLCVLSGRGLCVGLITRPEESCRLWCVVVCELETS